MAADEPGLYTDEPDPVVVEGIELRPDPDEAGVWTYLPPGPLLERGPDGTLAIDLIEAGPVNLLQLTSRLDLLDDDRARILEGLRRLRPSATSIRPLPVAVRRVALQVKAKDGEWNTVTEGTSSGNRPWTTALAATLTDEQAGATRSAINGEPGRLRLIGELTLPAAAAVRVAHATTDSLTLRTPAGTLDLSFKTQSADPAGPAGGDRTVRHVTDVADPFSSLHRRK